MKIRQGFVSNSSSSSFVVAFPEQPKSSEDVLEMMFPGNSPDEVISIYDYSKTCKEIADRVWQDVEKQLAKEPEDSDDLPLIIEKVTDIFKGRYYYLSGNSIDTKVVNDQYIIVETPNCQSCKEEYFGIVEGQLEEVLKWELKENEQYRDYANKLRDLRAKLKLEDPHHDLPDEEYDRLADQNWQKLEASDEYKSLWSEHCTQDDEMHKLRHEAIRKVAESDAKAFLEANYDAFILYTGYSDDCEALMEHGEIFRNLEYVRINEH